MIKLQKINYSKKGAYDNMKTTYESTYKNIKMFIKKHRIQIELQSIISINIHGKVLPQGHVIVTNY